MNMTKGKGKMGHGTEEHEHSHAPLPQRTLINHGLQLVNARGTLLVGKTVSDSDWLFLTNAYEVESDELVSESLKPSSGVAFLGLVKVPMNSVHFMVQLNPEDWSELFGA